MKKSAPATEIEFLAGNINSMKFVIFHKRSMRIAKRTTEIVNSIPKEYKDSAGYKMEKLLLNTCLEDIELHLSRFVKKGCRVLKIDKDLAVRIVKYGTDHEEFVKLNERLQHCIVEMKIPVRVSDIFNDLDDSIDFDQDYTFVISELPNFLSMLTIGPNETILTIQARMVRVTEDTTKMIERQKLNRSSYKSKRAASDDIEISPSDLVFLKGKFLYDDEVIGKGGFGVVYRGAYKGEPVAIKKLNPESSLSSSLEQFKFEANIMRRVSHPRTVACFGVSEVDGSHIMVMELLENDCLYYFVADTKIPIPWSQKLDIALDVAEGMCYLHRLRIVHRDLKSPNVLLDGYLRAKVADFGLSIVKDLAVTNVMMHEAGTTHYMAPECFGVSSMFSSRSDVFAYAIILWELAEWSFPYNGLEKGEIRDKVCIERYRPTLSESVPVAISTLIDSCWSQNPAKRPSFREICQFLEKLDFSEGFSNSSIPFKKKEVESSAEGKETPIPILQCSNTALHKLWLNITADLDQEVTWNQFFDHVILFLDLDDPADLDTERLRKKLDPSSNLPKPVFSRLYQVIKESDPKHFFLRFLKSSQTPTSNDASQNQLLLNLPQSNHGKDSKPLSLKPEEETTKNRRSWSRILKDKKRLGCIILAVVLLLVAAISTLVAVLESNNKSSAAAIPGTSTSSSSSPTSTLGITNYLSTTATIQELSPSSNQTSTLGITNYLSTTATIQGLLTQTESSSTPLITGCLSGYPTVSTFAGLPGSAGSSNGPLLTSTFNSPLGISLFNDTFYVVEAGASNTLRVLARNQVSTMTFTGMSFSNPSGQIDVDSMGNTYIPVSTPGKSKDFLAFLNFTNSNTTIFSGNINFVGNPYQEGSATTARFAKLSSVAFNNSIMYVTDGNRIRMVDSSGTTSIYAGSTTANYQDGTLLQATFNAPSGMAFTDNGEIYVADTGNNIIRKISQGHVTTFAGNATSSGHADGKPGSFSGPTDIVLGNCGNLFVTDSLNNMIRMVSPDGTVSTIAGRTTAGSANGVGLSATFSSPRFMVRNGTDIFVTDYSNQVIRKLAFS